MLKGLIEKAPRISAATGIAVIAVAARLTAAWLLRDLEVNPDGTEDYLCIASNIRRHGAFLNAYGLPDATRGPVYPLFVALVQLLAGAEPWKVRIAQALADAGTALLVFRTAKLVGSSRAATLAGGIYALHPLVIYATALITPDTLFGGLLALSLYLLISALADIRYDLLFLSGLVLGLATLCRATSLFLIVAWMAVLPRATRGNWRSSGILLSGFLICIAPWTLRNAYTFHTFIPVTANGGSNFYAGSSTAFFVAPDEQHRQQRLRERQLVALGEVVPRGVSLDPAAADRYAFTLGWANYRLAWKDGPRTLIALFARKLGRLFGATHSGRHSRFVALANGLMMLIVIRGLPFASPVRPGPPRLWILWVTALYFVGAFTSMYPLARYVVDFTPVLATLGGFAAEYGRSPQDETTTEIAARSDVVRL